MFQTLKPFLRVLMVAPITFAVGYLSFFTPYRLLQGDGFTDDLQLALVTIGIFAGLLFFSKPKKEIELFSPGESANKDQAEPESNESDQPSSNNN